MIAWAWEAGDWSYGRASLEQGWEARVLGQPCILRTYFVCQGQIWVSQGELSSSLTESQIPCLSSLGNRRCFFLKNSFQRKVYLTSNTRPNKRLVMLTQQVSDFQNSQQILYSVGLKFSKAQGCILHYSEVCMQGWSEKRGTVISLEPACALPLSLSLCLCVSVSTSPCPFLVILP